MRPTLMPGMQLGHQKTPSAGHPVMTYDGKRLGFALTEASNEKIPNRMAKEPRFSQYKLWEKITGKFLGPGSHNDDGNFYYLKKNPCNAVIKQPKVGGKGVMAGSSCFISQGHAIKFEPTLLKRKVRKIENKMKINLRYEINKIPATQLALNSSHLKKVRRRQKQKSRQRPSSMNLVKQSYNNLQLMDPMMSFSSAAITKLDQSYNAPDKSLYNAIYS